MNKEGFKYPTIHSFDAGLYDVSYRERFDKWTDSKAEISFLEQHDHVNDHIDVLISNFLLSGQSCKKPAGDIKAI